MWQQPTNSFAKRILPILLLAPLFIGQTLRAQNASPELRQFCDAAFARWDRNHDGMLDPKEINALVENPQVRGTEAAAVVAIRGHLPQTEEDTEAPGFSREQLLAVADDHTAQREFSTLKKRVQSINHTLFLPGDPKIFSVRQGRLGDCYLLAVIGACISRDPQSVRSMIQTAPGDAFEVRFPTGKTIAVAPLTDAELIMGANLNAEEGIWLSVLEKAFAHIREEKRDPAGDKTAAPDDNVARDLLRGGRAPPTIEQWTGHKAQRVVIPRAYKGDHQKAADALNDLFIKLGESHRLTTVGTAGKTARKLPKGIPGAHVFAVLAYNSERRSVHLFNPWGNDFTPAGTPGLVNGYTTRHGIFDVPLRDFVQFFQAVSYETEQPFN